MQSNVNKIIGSNIKKIRKSNGLSAEDLGNMINLSRSTISNIENNHQGLYADTLWLIAKALNVKIEDFYPTKKKNQDMPKTIQIAEEWANKNL